VQQSTGGRNRSVAMKCICGLAEIPEGPLDLGSWPDLWRVQPSMPTV
jgi:hypothetical protein